MAAVSCVIAASAAAQTASGLSSGLTPPPRAAASPASTLNSLSSPQNPFFGGTLSQQVTPGVLQLSVLEAINRGLQYNLGLQLTAHQAQAVRGARWRALSELLPNLVTRTSETAQQVNLAAFGFKGFPGTPPVVGPFGVFDTRVFLTQSLLDFHAIERARAETQNVKAAVWNYRNARELVVLVVGGLYLQALAQAARLDAARAQFTTAETLYNQAVDMKRAGTVAGIDVLRAQVEMQAQRQRVVAAGNEFEKGKLTLARAIGLPAGQVFALSEKVPFAPAPELTLDEALATAYANRADYQAAQAQVRAADTEKSAARGEALPSLRFNGDYGVLGARPGSSHGTFTATASLRVPIFQGGKVHGEVLAADAALKQRRAELEDLRGRIGYEVRTAFLDLKSAAEQVQVAQGTVDLARQQLTQAQDRFAAGVAGNLDVVQAQESVATANENYISSLNIFNVTKLALARALGVAERETRKYFGGSK